MNYLELINLLSKFDASFATKSATILNTWTWTSKRLQNEMIETISKVMHQKITNEVENNCNTTSGGASLGLGGLSPPLPH
jgi:hypothetical protein